MALVWRLARPEFATELNGEGNAKTGARWNSPGRGVIYASFNLSLCVLESFVHLHPLLRINLPEMTAVRIEIPDESSRLDIDLADLPSDLAGEEAEHRCRELGDGWLTAQEHLAFTMPSVLVPQERNLMINPAHRLMTKVKIISTERFRFDPRLATSSA
jgi:RES domain-containing protein